MGFKPENIEAFKAIFEKSRSAIKSFNGCKQVELLQDENDPTVFFTYSLWHSEKDLNVYRDSELFKKVWGSTKLLFNQRPEAWSVKEIKF